MKMDLELPSGLRITFEGDRDEFESFTTLLDDIPAFIETLGVQVPESESETPSGDDGDDQSLEPPASGNPLSPRVVAERMQSVGATTDMERVTVLAQLAVEAGRPGIDGPTADDLFEELGYPKPPRWSRTFFNAKQRNLLRANGRGVYRPTVNGENFARLGHRQSGPRLRSVSSPRPQPSLLEEGDGGDE